MKTAIFFLVGIGIAAALFFGFKPSTHEHSKPIPLANMSTVKGSDHTLKFHVGSETSSNPLSIDIKQGESVSFIITSDITDELHLHGYDIHLKLRPEQTAMMSFKANLSGRFGYELHKSHRELGVIQVHPK